MSNTRLIKDMQIGETGYTLPWALYSYPPNYLFARGDYPVSKEVDGTMTLGITRVDSVFWQLAKPLANDRKLGVANLRLDWDWVQVKQCKASLRWWLIGLLEFDN